MIYRDPAPRDLLWQVDGRRFCAGLVTRGDVIVETAPILRWALGQSRRRMSTYFRAKGWSVTLASRDATKTTTPGTQP